MAEIYDLSKVRGERDKPNAKYIKHDDFGREMHCYLIDYVFDGGEWSAELWAYSVEDAKARVDAMRESLILKGQLMDIVPA